MFEDFDKKIKSLFKINIIKKDGVFTLSKESSFVNQQQTNEAFSEKWSNYDKEKTEDKNKFSEFQKNWYLKLYNFCDEHSLKSYLSNKEIILDAGCGLGFKAKWFADLSPNSLIVAMDYSESIFLASKRYSDTPNLKFVKNDVANTQIKNDLVDYISCDQVLHHTENPHKTMIEFFRILKSGSELAVYVYAKKALPRELLDDYFRCKTKNLSNEELWKLSEQLTELGKRLSDLKINIDVPEISLLGIKAGNIDIQRFIYWNFLKCFWNKDLGKTTSISTNYDWYSPSNAFRYSKEEFEELLNKSNFKIDKYHSEEACHSGRFIKC